MEEKTDVVGSEGSHAVGGPGLHTLVKSVERTGSPLKTDSLCTKTRGNVVSVGVARTSYDCGTEKEVIVSVEWVKITNSGLSVKP